MEQPNIKKWLYLERLYSRNYSIREAHRQYKILRENGSLIPYHPAKDINEGLHEILKPRLDFWVMNGGIKSENVTIGGHTYTQYSMMDEPRQIDATGLESIDAYYTKFLQDGQKPKRYEIIDEMVTALMTSLCHHTHDVLVSANDDELDEKSRTFTFRQLSHKEDRTITYDFLSRLNLSLNGIVTTQISSISEVGGIYYTFDNNIPKTMLHNFAYTNDEVILITLSEID